MKHLANIIIVVQMLNQQASISKLHKTLDFNLFSGMYLPTIKDEENQYLMPTSFTGAKF
jgi:hypothetical protein